MYIVFTSKNSGLDIKQNLSILKFEQLFPIRNSVTYYGAFDWNLKTVTIDLSKGNVAQM